MGDAMPHRSVNVLTLGVRDLSLSSEFYRAIGFVLSSRSDEHITWFITGGTVLALYPWDMLADDAQISAEGQGFRGTATAINLASEMEVDEFSILVRKSGGKMVKEPQKVFWGGYHFYFQDPDGHLWEVAYNPYTPLDDKGRLMVDD